ncbi:MBL fold metallo-hydrolase [Paenibacillus sp. WQ 127069]|uniref:MBL fold metallo-hydrolase n=1 Tax=Paenibacillus baimaensis TaxID=2982185 RepID=A0ABT2UCA8_9BACL|nr:MBL fold metallo-hydrolase [Paenibacillus sp. WQ 127069]MCU6792235.1 MBL fold metallo-hydrolase [Paenibacillus sp. WQ 127069]
MAANHELIKWKLLTLGCLSRNKFWGEDEGKAYRRAYCTTVLLVADGKNILIDPSFPAEEMGRILDARCGLTHADIDVVYLTHSHGDHVVDIHAFDKAALFMAKEEFHHLKNPHHPHLSGVRPAEASLAAGIEYIHLPGHTLGLTGLVFQAAEGTIVLASDAAMTQDFYRAKQGYFNNVDPVATVNSINRIAEIADIVIPGHDNYFLVKSTGLLK